MYGPVVTLALMSQFGVFLFRRLFDSLLIAMWIGLTSHASSHSVKFFHDLRHLFLCGMSLSWDCWRLSFWLPVLSMDPMPRCVVTTFVEDYDVECFGLACRDAVMWYQCYLTLWQTVMCCNTQRHQMSVTSCVHLEVLLLHVFVQLWQGEMSGFPLACILERVAMADSRFPVSHSHLICRH